MRPVALVTGASAGIGAATAVALAKAGWDLALHYRADREGAASVAGLVAAEGGRAVMLRADLGNSDAVAPLFAALDRAFPRLDLLVNNAGIVDDAVRVDEMTPERLARMFAINTIAPILCAGAAVRRMSTAFGGEGGVIVNISSAAARLGSAGQYVDYAASKGAIDTFTRGLAEEVAAEGIRVVAIRPGIIETAIHGKGGQPDRAARLGPMIPMRRAGRADEVAAAIVWLASDNASYVTGSFLDVSGGR